MNHSHKELVKEFLIRNYDRGAYLVKYEYDGDIKIIPFDKSLNSWIQALQNQSQIWDNGEIILDSEMDWCSYAKTALNLMDEHTRLMVCKTNPEILSSASSA